MKSAPLQIENKKGAFKVALVYRIHTEKAVQAATQLSAWLKKEGIEVLTGPEQKKAPGTKLMKQAREFQKVSLVIDANLSSSYFGFQHGNPWLFGSSLT
jgi:hypothetical protein